ncbi:MAG: hypothetical protein WDN66_01580 [Candidatus Saccharibacteria bacterium]
MERPSYDETITRQNDIYAMEITERYRSRPKTANTLLEAITYSFILGAGGYEGSFDAAITLEYGGMAVLLESLGLTGLDRDLSSPVDADLFDDAVRASIDFGASWDSLEEEIPKSALSDTEITGDPLLEGPLTGRFNLARGRQPWLPE